MAPASEVMEEFTRNLYNIIHTQISASEVAVGIRFTKHVGFTGTSLFGLTTAQCHARKPVGRWFTAYLN
jgi:hypothetical protein